MNLDHQRASAFRPRPDPQGFDERLFQTVPPSSAGLTSTAGILSAASLARHAQSSSRPTRPVPDTPQRRPAKVSAVPKLLYSSEKKPPRLLRMQSPLPGPSSSTISTRKRYKDAATDRASPLRPSASFNSLPSLSKGERDEMEEETDFSESEDDDLAPDSIPKVQRREKLGTGHFGDVWMVLCTENNKRYALKEEKTQITDGRRDSVIAELKLWDSLRHRRITRFFRAWEDESKLHVLMELCEGGTLLQFVDGHTNLNMTPAIDPLLLLAAFRDCCTALEFMHSQQLVHMDIKPNNICIRRGRALLCDMELMGQVGRAFKRETDIQYCAYEVFMEGTDVYCIHPSADIFSIGITFLHLAAWQAPPPNGDEWTHLRRAGLDPRQYPRLGQHPELARIIARCMSLDPSARPQAQNLLAESLLEKLSKDIKLIPVALPGDAIRDTRPASAVSFVGSPREGDTIRHAWVTEILSPASPVPPLPIASRASSRNPSPFTSQKKLDFSSTCTSPINAMDLGIDEVLSDRFTSQAVVTPRPSGSNTPMLQLSRSSSPRQ